MSLPSKAPPKKAVDQNDAQRQAEVYKIYNCLQKHFPDAGTAADYKPPVELLNRLDSHRKCTKIAQPTTDDEVFEPDQNIVYIDKTKFPEIARALGFDVGSKSVVGVESQQPAVEEKGDAADAEKKESNTGDEEAEKKESSVGGEEAEKESLIDNEEAETNECPVFESYLGSQMKDDPFFYPCNKATAYLKTNYVAYGPMVNKVLSKQLVVHKGALVFDMEVRVPTDPNTTEKFGSYSDYTCEHMHFRIFFNHISGIFITHLDDNAGAMALTFSVIPASAKDSQKAFKTLGLPPAVYNDKRYHTFVFELPYNYFESYKHVHLFLLMCNYWAKEYNPDRTSPITGFQRASDFNKLLEPAGLRLAPIQNTLEYDCYMFASITKDTDEQKPIGDFEIQLPTHTIHLKHFDISDLMVDCDVTADMVDFYIFYEAVSLLRKNHKEVGILPSNFYTLFIENFDANDTPVERSYKITRNWSNIKCRYQIEDDVFSKAYILMPVCLVDHWYLIVITHPSACLLPNGGLTPTVKFIDGFSKGSTKDTEFQNVLTFLEFHFNQVQENGKFIGKEFNRDRYVKVVHNVTSLDFTNAQSAIFATLYADVILRTYALAPVDAPFNEKFSLEDVAKFTHYVPIKDTMAAQKEYAAIKNYKPQEVV